MNMIAATACAQIEAMATQNAQVRPSHTPGAAASCTIATSSISQAGGCVSPTSQEAVVMKISEPAMTEIA